MAETINKKRQTDEIRRCARDPIYFFNTYVKVSHPTKGPIPFNTYPFQDDCVNAFIEHRYVIVNKSRQLGLSTLAAAYAAWLLIFHRNKEVIIMATKLKVAMNFIRKVKFCVQNLPKWLVLPKIVEDNKQSLVFGQPSNSRIEAIPTAADAGRSEALSLLIVDEAAHVADFEELWKGLYPTLSCVVGGTKVLLDDGFHDIDELCAGHDVGDYFELDGNIYGKDGLEPLSHGYVSPESETLKITTRKGLELEVTHKHPLWVLDAKEGGKMVKAQDLGLGDHLRVQYGMQVYGNDNSLDHPTVKEITPELAYLVGGYIAEGWMSKSKCETKHYGITVSNNDKEFRDAYLNNDIIKPFHPRKDSQKLLCCSRELVTVFEAVGVKPEWKCDTKRVPKKIWRCSEDVIGSFLRGYFDGDGCVTSSAVCASSTSRGLIADIHQLLLNMGFSPKILTSDMERAKKAIGVHRIAGGKPLVSVRPSWGIHLSRTQNALFKEKIGFAISRKAVKLDEFIEQYDQDSKKQFKVPLTPEVLGRIRSIVAETGKAGSWFRVNGVRLPEKAENAFSTKKAHVETVHYTTMQWMKDFCALLKKENLVSERDALFLDELSKGDYFWDPIVKIERSKNKTYDFTVPKTHSFLQNCILGSNTGGRALIISTPKGVGNHFHKLWVDAQDNTNEFHPIELPWTVHPERDEEWFNSQTSNMSPKAIAQELLCVAGETRIITKGGFKLAKDICVDDQVLTHKGRFRSVIHVHKRTVDPADEIVYSISTPGNRQTETVITGNHPILSQRLKRAAGMRVYEWLQQDEKRLDLSFQPAETLAAYKKLDNKNRVVAALFPRLKPQQQVIKRLDLLKMHDAAELVGPETVRYIRQWGSNKRFVEVDYDLGRFVGLWMSDGYSNPCGRYGFGFAFHRNEYDTLLKFVSDFLTKHGVRVRPSMMKTSNGCRIESHNQFFVNVIKHFTGGVYANDKILQWDNIIDAGNEFIKGLLVGYFEGDGTHNPDKKLTVTSCNAELLYQVRTLLSMFGHYPRIGYNKGNPGYLEIDSVEGRKLDVLINETKAQLELPTSRSRVVRDYIIGSPRFTKLGVDVEPIDVYNFEVEDDHTYVADSIVVHNCDFLSSGDTYLDAIDIDWVGKCVKPPIRRDGPDKNVWIWEEPIHDPSVKYVIAADVGRGDGDFSTFHVLCITTGEVVAEFRGKIRPDLFARLLMEYGRRYNTALICPERNTYGHHVIIELVNNGYSNIYFKNQKGVVIGDYIPPDRISEAGFDTQRDSRKQIVSKLEEVIRNKQIKVYSARLHNELKTFVTHGDKPEASKNCHDDLVIALAIAVWLFDASAVHSQFATSLNKAMLAGFSMSSNSFDNLAGNGNEVLPSWTGMVPYMGAAGGSVYAAPVPRRTASRRDDTSSLFWLWK